MKYFSAFCLSFFLILSFLTPAQQITFSDVAGSMGINHPFTFIRGSVSFSDFDGDGKDDLSFSSNEGQPMFIYRNDDTQFTDVTFNLGLVDTFRTMNLLWCDYDNDGDKDLFAAVDCECTYSRLYRNNDLGMTSAKSIKLTAKWASIIAGTERVRIYNTMKNAPANAVTMT